VRAKVLEFFAGQPRCLVALEACGGAHYCEVAPFWWTVQGVADCRSVCISCS
jgi:hypothetical protein